jgi:copper chaperone
MHMKTYTLEMKKCFNYKEENMETTTFNVPSITCNVCSGKISEGLKALRGINDVNVDLKTKTVNVNYDPNEVQPQDIRKRVSSLGYEVTQ